MLRTLKKNISRNLNNIPGFRTPRKIVVIESDDWGSIRTPSKAVYDSLLESGLRVDLCPYNQNDSLESKQDLQQLFQVLSSHNDVNGRHPVITANTNPVNPDFNKIRKSNFQEYHFEVFTETLKRYYPNDDVWAEWQTGIKQGFLHPQYHSREHINPILWLQLLREGNEALHKAFEQEMFGLSLKTSPLINKPFLSSLIYEDRAGFEYISKSLKEGLDIFKSVFGFTPKSFIAPLNTWSVALEQPLAEAGIKYLQGGNVHLQYDYATNKRKRTFHKMGSRNESGQIYLHRNCTFEPAVNLQKDNVANCLAEMEIAFLWSKPAVICSHRLNYIGSINSANRENNLKQLNELLRQITNKWPDAEFMTSDELGMLIAN